MKEAQLKEIEALEKELRFLIKEGMTLDEKLRHLPIPIGAPTIRATATILPEC